MAEIILSKFREYHILKGRCDFINNDVYEGCNDMDIYEGLIDSIYVKNGYLLIIYYSIIDSKYCELELPIENMTIYGEDEYEDGSKTFELRTYKKCKHKKYNDKFEVIAEEEVVYDYVCELYKSPNEKISIEFIFDCLCEDECDEHFLTRNLKKLKDDTILKYLELN